MIFLSTTDVNYVGHEVNSRPALQDVDQHVSSEDMYGGSTHKHVFNAANAVLAHFVRYVIFRCGGV